MKNISLLFSIIMLVILMMGCDSGGEDIVVVSREDGSGTKGAFIELLGIEEEDADGNKTDRTTEEATIVNSTSIVMTTVADNKDAIGYISLGSLNDTVKALNVDGAEATVDNIKNGSYGISRPFNIATRSEVSELAQDFIDFILSTEGQRVVEETGFTSATDQGSYGGSKPAGKITVAGSTSVTPVMEKLKEAYEEINPDASIEIQSVGSSAGVNAAIDGTADIGMASRELKDSELAELEGTVIALDGIAIIVNNENELDNISMEQIKDIFVGEITMVRLRVENVKGRLYMIN